MPTIDLGSVVGPQGAQGPQGATGATGAQGAAGPNQVTAATSTTLTGALVGDGSTISARTIDSTPSSSHTNNLISSAAVADAITLAGDFNAPTNIEDSTDLNTLSTPGCYRCSTITHAKTMVNAPWTVGSDEAWPFALFVVRLLTSDATYYIQVLISATQVYTRRHYQTTYSDWTSMQEKVEADLASISLWESTNTTGSAIPKGTYFYRKGVLVRAIEDIANNATLTSGTNYETITKGILNELIQPKGVYVDKIELTKNVASTYTFKTYGPFLLFISRYAANPQDYAAVFFGIASTGSYSTIVPIVSSNHVTVSISSLVLTITGDNTWMFAYVVPLDPFIMA